MKKALVCGAGGFIGGHLVKRLKEEGYWVRGVDLKESEFDLSLADDFVIGDLRETQLVKRVVTTDLDEVYQLAADMGGAGYIFTGDNDAEIMHNSVLCNINVLNEMKNKDVKKVFYSSSACVYPEHNQLDPESPNCKEDSVYPADPDSEYGWEKLFSERLYLSYQKNYGIDVRIARFHNIFGPNGTWEGGKEKAPAALCRKVAEADEFDNIDVWGNGEQTRSFLYIDECLEGVRRLMLSDFSGPVNIGSDEMLSINELAEMIVGLSGKDIEIKNIQGPNGVKGRNSDNELIFEKLKWKPSMDLIDGLKITFSWIDEQVILKNKKYTETT
jgi:GDP-D-mannose 3', 5'-epimerase